MTESTLNLAGLEAEVLSFEKALVKFSLTMDVEKLKEEAGSLQGIKRKLRKSRRLLAVAKAKSKDAK